MIRRCAYMVAATLVLGCDAQSPADGWQARREVAGDTTTVHTLAGQVWPNDVHLVEDVLIGALDGPLEVMLGEVSRLAEDRDDGIYVLDAHGPIIRHYDRTGAFIRTVGGPGDGPGEYRRLSVGMVVDPAGTLYVHDWGNGRVVRFSPEGRALDPWRLDSPFLTTVPGTWVYSDRPDRILVPAVVDDHPALLVMDRGEVVDTLLVPRLPGLPTLRAGPYRVDLHWGWSVAGGHFVAGVSDRYSFEAHTGSGVLRIGRDVEPLPVHPDEADAWRRQFEWMDRHPSYRPPEGEWIPSHMPPFRSIDLAADGRIWVRRNTQPIPVDVEEHPDLPPPVGWAQPWLYDVFEADGTFLGEVRFPDRVQPLLFGAGHVWGVRKGDLDEHHVVRLTLRGEDR